MTYKKFVYLVGTPTGQYTSEGDEILLVYAVKLTKNAADRLSETNPGTHVYKREADKT